MKEVLAFIHEKKQEFAQSPFIQYLQDTTIDPRQRLAWAPCFAPFAMNFKDINRRVLRKEPATSKVQEMINQHTYEDGRHWIWFLQDLKLLGFDYSLNYTDTLKFLWGEETKKTRQLAHDLYAICTFQDNPIMHLPVIETIEATGNVALYETANVADEIKQITNQHHPYFSKSHYDKESGHIQAHMEHIEVENFLENIELTEEQRQKAFELVEIVFVDFSDSMHEMYIFAQNHSYQECFIETAKNKLPLAVA